MSATFEASLRQVYKIQLEDGFRYVIYNAAAVGNPSDHVADRWYFGPYPLPLGLKAGQPFRTAADAERAARVWHATVKSVASADQSTR